MKKKSMNEKNRSEILLREKEEASREKNWCFGTEFSNNLVGLTRLLFGYKKYPIRIDAVV
jgi:hypothetical protein